MLIYLPIAHLSYLISSKLPNRSLAPTSHLVNVSLGAKSVDKDTTMYLDYTPSHTTIYIKVVRQLSPEDWRTDCHSYEKTFFYKVMK